MELQVPLCDLDYDIEEEKAVLEVVRSRWLTLGRVSQEFEQEFAGLVGARHAFAVTNCTDALHLAYLALGISPGDEVIVPSLTFVATANAVLYTGADVRFAEIGGLEDLTISPEDVVRQITSRTRAICVMHYGGYPCHMPELMRIAHDHNLVIVEDAAHAPAAFLEGIALGTWGEIGCYSFFSNKNLATGEGGMIVTDRDDLADKIRLLRSHGMTTLSFERHRGHAFSYDVMELGHNFRIDEIHSALGLVQLHKLRRNNERRKAITEQYRTLLRGPEFSELTLPFEKARGQSAYHIFPVLLPAGVHRERVMRSMREQGIQTSIHYPPIHHFTYYRKRFPGLMLPITEEVAARELTLPLFPTMTEAQVEYVVHSLAMALSATERPAVVVG